MTLNEELPRRLYDFAHFKGDSVIKDPAPDWDEAGSITREHWRRLGREVIRQMEWARLARDGRLTLAPTGWEMPTQTLTEADIEHRL